MKRPVLASALCALALLAAACSSGNSGISGKSPAQILTAVKQALASASSVKITGRVQQNGSVGAFDITTFSNGDFAGTINQGSGAVKVTRIANTDYLNASKSFWLAEGAPASAAQVLDGKWVYGTNTQVGLGSDFTLKSLSSQLTTPHSKVTKGVTGKVNGQSAQSLHTSQGTLWVALTGPAYPLEEIKTGSSGGVLYLTEWNQGTPPKAPAGAKSLTSMESQLS
jgi:hypothetical protein